MRKEQRSLKKIAFVVPYMGKLPNYFPLWLESCKKNENVDFIIFTDDHTEYYYPPNVHVHYMEFEELKELIQSNYDFQIELPTAYKVCDYKPAYGEIFREYLRDYDFWGHCDIDIIWGNIRQYVTDEIMDRHMRIFGVGHCSLFKNTPEVNSMYRILTARAYKTYREVFTNPNNMGFDEWPGVSSVMKINNVPFYYIRHHADLKIHCDYFKVIYRPDTWGKKSYFVYDRGELYWTDGKRRKDFLYVHIHRRKVDIKISEPYDRFVLCPPGIVEELTNTDANICSRGGTNYHIYCTCMKSI